MPKHERILIILASRNIAFALPSFRFNNVYLKMGRVCSLEPSNYRNHGMQLVVELQVDEGEIRIPAGINVWQHELSTATALAGAGLDIVDKF